MTTWRRQAAITGAVLLILGLAVVGFRLGYEFAGKFATPICPYTPGQPQCLAGGNTNGTAYYLAWYFGGALAVSLAGVGLLRLGRRLRHGGVEHRGRLLIIPVAALTFALATSGFVFVKMLAYQFVATNGSYFCGQLDCDEIIFSPPRLDFTAWGVGGAVAGVLVAWVLLRLGRTIWPRTRSVADATDWALIGMR